MAFKSSRGRDLGKELEIFMSTKIGQGLGSGSGGGVEATGGVTFTGPTYKYHFFTASGTFKVTSGTVIAQITASGGGGGGSGYAPGYYVATNGVDSVLTTPVTEFRAAGGGGGTRYNPGTAQPGGSGGGGGAPGPPTAAAGTGQRYPSLPSTPAPLRGQAAVSTTGNPGGEGISVYMGGGGGGAGAAGSDATADPGGASGNGGVGIALLGASADIPSDYGVTNPGSPGRWVCGGGGGSGGRSQTEGTGGIGGGGNGRGPADTNVPNSKGQVNTGGGGGAFNNYGGGGSGGGGAGGYYDSGLGAGLPPGTYPVVIGSGGAGAPDSHPDPGGQGGSGFLIIRYFK